MKASAELVIEMNLKTHLCPAKKLLRPQKD